MLWRDHAGRESKCPQMKNLARVEPAPERPTRTPKRRRAARLRQLKPKSRAGSPPPEAQPHSGGTPDSAPDLPSDEKAITPALSTWHPDEQPRERLMRYGPATLATSELIAILLRTGTTETTACDLARNLMLRVGGRLRELGSRDWRDLAREHGVGQVKAVTLLAALELGRRRGEEGDVERPLVIGSRAAFDLVGPHVCDLDHEECWVVLLNRASLALGCERLSVGGLDGTVVDVRSLMALCLRHGAAAFVLVHNHPSGAITPSDEDRAVTRRLEEAGRLMKIELRDHLVVGGRRYYSFADEGMIGG